MKAVQRAVCLVRRHDWQARDDGAGTLVICARCGKFRHVGGGSPDSLDAFTRDPTVQWGGSAARSGRK